jgi:hypothetical protein
MVRLFGLFMLVLAGCAIAVQADQPAESPTESVNQPVDERGVVGPELELPDLGLAPELTNEVWLNAAGPLRLAALRGKVVLLEMWTFG